MSGWDRDRMPKRARNEVPFGSELVGWSAYRQNKADEGKYRN